MPRKMKKKLPDLNINKMPIGEKISLLRKELGLTQNELANKIGIERTLIASYEIGRLHLNDEMIIRFAIALGVSSDEILGLKNNKNLSHNPDLKITKRLKQIANLPPTQRKSLLNTIDAYLKANLIKENK